MDATFNEVAAVVENHNPQEISRLLDQLAEMGLGRPLYVAQKTSPLSEKAQAETGIETPVETTLVKVGHALPANEDETSHIIIVPDGSMMYIETSRMTEVDIAHYKNLFSTTYNEPLSNRLLPEYPQTILNTLINSRLKGEFIIGSYLDGRLPEHYPQVKKKFDHALILAEERKKALEETKSRMRQDVAAGLKSLLHSPSSPPTTPPPASPSSAA